MESEGSNMDGFISSLIDTINSQTVINLFVVICIVWISYHIIKQVNNFISKLIDLVKNQDKVNENLNASIKKLDALILELRETLRTNYVSKLECSANRNQAIAQVAGVNPANNSNTPNSTQTVTVSPIPVVTNPPVSVDPTTTQAVSV